MQRDPVDRETRGSRDLYDVSTWERRSAVDTLAAWLYRVGVAGTKAFVVLLALAFLIAQFVLGGLGALSDPVVGVLVILSVVPAFAIAAYIWHIDVTTGEPLSLLVATFLLAVLFAMFAAVVNSLLQPAFGALPALIGLPLFFFLVVGPVEETVKLLAVRLFAYRDVRFDAVIDGAVYGAAAGLGFATIENAIYITRGLEAGLAGIEVIGAAGDTAATRALAGPGHVLYSSIAGYYLGLAKFNRENAGPIVIKGVLIAAFFHGLYNTLSGVVPSLLVAAASWITPAVALIGFIVLYDGLVGYFLYRKLSAYRRAYADAGIVRGEDEPTPELTEFDPDTER
ncbi:PrsW family intramembrane metalloprotease [Halalkalicoccus sp. NIPERK01]|uniref:PrsW family intramembrane metalloprotease n=1 Tax=Halalkalicoccus sp. NIPERK01 TaxID=3053469 RepID=UPI00256EBAD9|nr:PrsW family glutamic-type intramembrane protease [Halalkalicoccus sp. NIPERK01]MDL5361806.1 PrsW family glutamic-type intramembrane protease [Halalkalicoccus sp. NIPERK01]